MRDPDEDPDIDRAYRAAVDLLADGVDTARAHSRRRAVLEAVHAGGVQGVPGQAPHDGSAATAPRGSERLACKLPYWRRPAAWWNGAVAACVMAGSALVVVRMQSEPEADVPVNVADAGRQAAAPQEVAASPAPAPPPPSATRLAPAPAPEPAAPLPRGAGTARSPLPDNGSQGAAVVREPSAQHALDDLATAPAPTSADARPASARDERAVPPLAKAQAEAPAPAPALTRPALAARPQAATMPAPQAAAEDQAHRERSPNAAAAPPRGDLLAAVVAGEVDVVRKILIRASPDSERDGDGRTALTLAVLRSDAALVTLLLDHGADRLSQDRFGQTPVGYALAAGNPAVRRALALE